MLSYQSNAQGLSWYRIKYGILGLLFTGITIGATVLTYQRLDWPYSVICAVCVFLLCILAFVLAVKWPGRNRLKRK